MTNYKKSYQRFLRSKAWQRTKTKVLAKRRKKGDKKGFSIGTNQFRCDKCKAIYYLSFANYHHKNYKNWYGGFGWSTPSNVTIICRNCHEHIKDRIKERYNLFEYHTSLMISFWKKHGIFSHPFLQCLLVPDPLNTHRT